MDNDERYAKLVNASGFAFQLALEAAVRADGSHGWRVAAREYPWSTLASRGYIDLVLSRGNVHLAVECKRTREATWAFLMPDEEQMKRSHARVRWTNTVPHRRPLSDWGDIQLYPASPEAELCVVRGQGEKDAPLLERLAGSVTEAAEGLAAALLELDEQSRRTQVIVPAIVTNAELVVSRFDPNEIDLHSGDLGWATFSRVKHLRFRKSLGLAASPDELEPTSLRDLEYAAVRTVFVVTAAHLVEWLREFEIGSTSLPWESARAAADAMDGA